jgi:hypothetical protein
VNTGSPATYRRSHSTRFLSARFRSAAIAAAVAATATLSVLAAPVAAAAERSQFTVVRGSIETATGTPVPASGSHATLPTNRGYAVTTVSGAGRVDIGAIGTYCQGWPTIRVEADGVTLGDLSILDAGRYGSYPVGGPLAAGRHRIMISLLNDFAGGGCDRNVSIGSARIVAAAPVPPTSTPAPTTTTRPPTTAPPTSTTTTRPPTTTTPTTTTPTITTRPPTTTAPTTTTRPAPTTAPTTTTPPAPTTTTPTTTAPTTTTPTPPTPGQVAGPDNTGVPDGTVLTVHNGDLTVRTAGTVIDAMDIRGFLKIEANDVTVKRSIIRGRDPGTVNIALVSVFGETRNFTISDSTLLPTEQSQYLDGLKGRQFTATRLDVSGTVDTALVFGDNVTIQNSWFHDATYFSPYPQQPDNQTHNDALQIEGGNHIRVTGNTLEGAHNTAVMITQNYARTTDVVISGNILSDGGCTVNLSDKNKGPMQVTLQDNRFGPSRLNCAVVSPGETKPTMINNTYLATGGPVGINRG